LDIHKVQRTAKPEGQGTIACDGPLGIQIWKQQKLGLAFFLSQSGILPGIAVERKIHLPPGGFFASDYGGACE
jgi:hypothetical protein